MRRAGCILVVLGLLLALPAGTGCRRRVSTEDSRREIAEAYGRLPGLHEAPDAKLRAELARIIEEHGTPELLAQGRIPDEENVARPLAELFEPSKVPSILEKSSQVFPADEFELSPTSLERAIRFRQQYETQRQQAREALRRPTCSFGIDYQAGFAAELTFVDVVRICARLEAFRAAESLARNDLPAAVESLAAMFRLAACLGAEKHATVRLQAAFVRSEALAVLRAVVQHPQISRPIITREQLAQLYAMVERQLKSWPPDRDAWLGDRALGMHAYEMVRAGRLMELLTEDEARQFADEGILTELPAAAQRNVNEDELYYLEAMQKILDACAKPYYERTEVFDSIRQDLHENRNSPHFPLVAGRLLLGGIQQGQEVQARDRATCEAWALALATASGLQRPPYQVSPLSGGKYEVVREDGLVTVSGISTDEALAGPPIVVPDLVGKAEGQ